MKPKKITLSMLLLLAISFAAKEGVAALNPGSISIGISAISAGNSPGTFAVLSPAGGTGLYTYLWQELDDSTHWSDIAGEQLPTFTPPALNATTYYRRKVTSGAEVAYSNVVTVYVYEAASSFTQDLELGEDDHSLSTSNNTQSVYLPWKRIAEHISTDEKVFIGSPSNPTVEDLLHVNGRLKTNEITVESESWSDFVFDTEYKLKSLEEVDAFIKMNKHLPDVPPAREVEEKGLSLGEMNAILLQKIEELTLYILDQEKRIQALERIEK